MSFQRTETGTFRTALAYSPSAPSSAPPWPRSTAGRGGSGWASCWRR